MIRGTYLLLMILVISCSKEGNELTSEVVKFNLEVKSSEGGTVNTEGGNYLKGTEVVIVATPNNEYNFNSWSDGVKDNPRTITVSSNTVLTAQFSKKLVYLSDNGVTIISQSFAEIGKEYELNGKLYKVVDRQILKEMIDNGADVTRTVTTFISDFSYLFYSNQLFNQDIGSWDTSSVQDMSYMFYGASSFNHDLNYWDTSSVQDMSFMFRRSTSFNGDVKDWDTSSVENMEYMFAIAPSFNHPIGEWDVSNVESMRGMFFNDFNVVESDFNQPLNNWDVSNVKDMSLMFWRSYSFNQNLINWNVSKVEDMRGMFRYAKNFNGNIVSWNVGKVVNMMDLFYYASSFNQDLSSWRTEVVDYCSDFSIGATLWELPKPSFNKCNPEETKY